MRPNTYFDIEVIGGGGDNGMQPVVLRGRLLAMLHAFFEKHESRYAVAIPNGGRGLRVFASAREELDALAAYLQPQAWFRDYARLAYPQMVPANFAGTWTSYARFRIPTLKSDRKTGDEHGQLRTRRMKAAADARMDYFILRSHSTGQGFTLTVQRDRGAAPIGECLPNSYGFGSSSRAVSLPDLP